MFFWLQNYSYSLIKKVKQDAFEIKSLCQYLSRSWKTSKYFRVWNAISQSITIVRDIVFHKKEYSEYNKRFYLKYFSKEEKRYGIAMSKESDKTSINPLSGSKNMSKVRGHWIDSLDLQLGTASRSQDVAINYLNHIEC